MHGVFEGRCFGFGLFTVRGFGGSGTGFRERHFAVRGYEFGGLEVRGFGHGVSLFGVFKVRGFGIGVSATGLRFRGFVIWGFCRFVVFEVLFFEVRCFGYVVSRTGFSGFGVSVVRCRVRGFVIRGFCRFMVSSNRVIDVRSFV